MSFYNNKSFLNMMYALDIALIEHYANMLFDDDQTRIVYSSTAYAMRKRSETQQYNNLNLPFMNFKIAPGGIVNGVDRRWFNHNANVHGAYDSDLGVKLRLTPVTYTYESTVFVQEEIDAQYVAHQILWDDSNETILTYYIDYGGHQIKNIGILAYNPNFTPQYNESDWLQSNKIKTITLDMSVQTFMIIPVGGKPDGEGAFTIPETVLFNFVQNAIGSEPGTVEENYQATIDHLTEEVGALSEA